MLEENTMVICCIDHCILTLPGTHTHTHTEVKWINPLVKVGPGGRGGAGVNGAAGGNSISEEKRVGGAELRSLVSHAS